MTLNRRDLIMGSAAGLALASAPALMASENAAASLKPMLDGVEPISPGERRSRIARAQALLARHEMSAVFVETGPSLTYFSGINWPRNDRLTGMVIPGEGEPLVVTTHFEEASVRESLAIPATVRTWHEDEDPLLLIGGWLREKKLADGVIGIEETVRQFLVEALGNAVPGASLRSGNPVVRGCRMYKSAAEIALMQRANDITLAAYAHTIRAIQKGMAQGDIETVMTGAMTALGGRRPWAMVLVGEASAYPHGSKNPKSVEQGDIILMDCGCAVQGYQADISRTFVFGTPSPAHRKTWSHVRRGQDVAFEAARVGETAGSVDDAVRRFYESLGYGPRYELPGLSHRTGHGIGMEGHEPVHLVGNERTPLAAGMCFSNEPGLYAPGAFGVRLEDCFYITSVGPRWFTQPSQSIDNPV